MARNAQPKNREVYGSIFGHQIFSITKFRCCKFCLFVSIRATTKEMLQSNHNTTINKSIMTNNHTMGAVLATTLAYILLSASTVVSAYTSNYCDRERCCWAQKVYHPDVYKMCYGCDNLVCNHQQNNNYNTNNNNYNKYNSNVSWKSDGWNTNNGKTVYDDWNGGSVYKVKVDNWNGWGTTTKTYNYCCQTTEYCPDDTPIVAQREWLNRAARVRLTIGCDKEQDIGVGDSYGRNSWGDSYGQNNLGGNRYGSYNSNGGRNSYQNGYGGHRALWNSWGGTDQLQVCETTFEPTLSPTFEPSRSPQPSSRPSDPPNFLSFGVRPN